MTGAITLPREVELYLEGVRAALADLPAEERDELLADVEAAVHDAASESGEPIAQRLGTPETFARELRSAAGLEAGTTSAAAPRRSALRRMVARIEKVGADPRLQRVRDLRALWWVLRAYVAVAVMAHVVGAGWSLSQPLFPKLVAQPGISAAYLLAAIVGSVWLGMSRRRGRALTALNLGLALAAIPVAAHILDARATTETTVFVESVPEVASQQGLVRDGVPITNIYPYTRDGRPLYDVLLYDENGQPLNIGGPQVEDPDRRLLADARGRSLFNSFPIRYFEPGTTRVSKPTAAPGNIEIPEITTPPLRTKRR